MLGACDALAAVAPPLHVQTLCTVAAELCPTGVLFGFVFVPARMFDSSQAVVWPQSPSHLCELLPRAA